METEQHPQIVYVRPVEVSDLPKEIRVQAPPGIDRIYALHNEDGQRLARRCPVRPYEDKACASVVALCRIMSR